MPGVDPILVRFLLRRPTLRRLMKVQTHMRMKDQPSSVDGHCGKAIT
jgi:hypothetical protein